MRVTRPWKSLPVALMLLAGTAGCAMDEATDLEEDTVAASEAAIGATTTRLYYFSDATFTKRVGHQFNICGRYYPPQGQKTEFYLQSDMECSLGDPSPPELTCYQWRQGLGPRAIPCPGTLRWP